MQDQISLCATLAAFAVNEEFISKKKKQKKCRGWNLIFIYIKKVCNTIPFFSSSPREFCLNKKVDEYSNFCKKSLYRIEERRNFTLTEEGGKVEYRGRNRLLLLQSSHGRHFLSSRVQTGGGFSPLTRGHMSGQRGWETCKKRGRETFFLKGKRKKKGNERIICCGASKASRRLSTALHILFKSFPIFVSSKGFV